MRVRGMRSWRRISNVHGVTYPLAGVICNGPAVPRSSIVAFPARPSGDVVTTNYHAMIPGRFAPRRFAAHEDPDFYSYGGDGYVTDPPADVIAALRRIGRRVITYVERDDGCHIKSEPFSQGEL